MLSWLPFARRSRDDELELVYERCRKEVQFWKNELERAVTEKILQRQEIRRIANYSIRLKAQLDAQRLQRRCITRSPKASSPSPVRSCSPVRSPKPESPVKGTEVEEFRFHDNDMQWPLLKDRNTALTTENGMLLKQVSDLKEEISMLKGLNEETAEEAARVWTALSQMQQETRSLQNELKLKEDVIFLLSQQLTELNGDRTPRMSEEGFSLQRLGGEGDSAVGTPTSEPFGQSSSPFFSSSTPTLSSSMPALPLEVFSLPALSSSMSALPMEPFSMPSLSASMPPPPLELLDPSSSGTRLISPRHFSDVTLQEVMQRLNITALKLGGRNVTLQTLAGDLQRSAAALEAAAGPPSRPVAAGAIAASTSNVRALGASSNASTPTASQGVSSAFAPSIPVTTFPSGALAHSVSIDILDVSPSSPMLDPAPTLAPLPTLSTLDSVPSLALPSPILAPPSPTFAPSAPQPAPTSLPTLPPFPAVPALRLSAVIRTASPSRDSYRSSRGNTPRTTAGLLRTSSGPAVALPSARSSSGPVPWPLLKTPSSQDSGSPKANLIRSRPGSIDLAPPNSDLNRDRPGPVDSAPPKANLNQDRPGSLDLACPKATSLPFLHSLHTASFLDVSSSQTVNLGSPRLLDTESPRAPMECSGPVHRSPPPPSLRTTQLAADPHVNASLDSFGSPVFGQAGSSGPAAAGEEKVELQRPTLSVQSRVAMLSRATGSNIEALATAREEEKIWDAGRVEPTPGASPKAQVKGVAKPKLKAKSDAAPDIEDMADVAAKPEAPKVDALPNAEGKADATPKPGATLGVEMQTCAALKGMADAAPKSEAKADPAPKAKAAAKPDDEIYAAPKGEVDAVPQAEAKHLEPQTAPARKDRATAGTMAKAEAEAGAVSKAKAQADAAADAETKRDALFEAEARIDAVPKTEAEPSDVVAPEVEVSTGAVLKKDAAANGEVKADAEPKAESTADAAPQSYAVIDFNADAELDTKVDAEIETKVADASKANALPEDHAKVDANPKPKPAAALADDAACVSDATSGSTGSLVIRSPGTFIDVSAPIPRSSVDTSAGGSGIGSACNSINGSTCTSTDMSAPTTSSIVDIPAGGLVIGSARKPMDVSAPKPRSSADVAVGSLLFGSARSSIDGSTNTSIHVSAPKPRSSVDTTAGILVIGSGRSSSDGSTRTSIDLSAPRPCSAIDVPAGSLIIGSARSSIDVSSPIPCNSVDVPASGSMIGSARNSIDGSTRISIDVSAPRPDSLVDVPAGSLVINSTHTSIDVSAPVRRSSVDIPAGGSIIGFAHNSMDGSTRTSMEVSTPIPCSSVDVPAASSAIGSARSSIDGFSSKARSSVDGLVPQHFSKTRSSVDGLAPKSRTAVEISTCSSIDGTMTKPPLPTATFTDRRALGMPAEDSIIGLVQTPLSLVPSLDHSLDPSLAKPDNCILSLDEGLLPGSFRSALEQYSPTPAASIPTVSETATGPSPHVTTPILCMPLAGSEALTPPVPSDSPARLGRETSTPAEGTAPGGVMQGIAASRTEDSTVSGLSLGSGSSITLPVTPVGLPGENSIAAPMAGSSSSNSLPLLPTGLTGSRSSISSMAASGSSITLPVPPAGVAGPPLADPCAAMSNALLLNFTPSEIAPCRPASPGRSSTEGTPRLPLPPMQSTPGMMTPGVQHPSQFTPSNTPGALYPSSLTSSLATSNAPDGLDPSSTLHPSITLTTPSIFTPLNTLTPTSSVTLPGSLPLDSTPPTVDSSSLTPSRLREQAAAVAMCRFSDGIIPTGSSRRPSVVGPAIAGATALFQTLCSTEPETVVGMGNLSAGASDMGATSLAVGSKKGAGAHSQGSIMGDGATGGGSIIGAGTCTGGNIDNAGSVVSDGAGGSRSIAGQGGGNSCAGVISGAGVTMGGGGKLGAGNNAAGDSSGMSSGAARRHSVDLCGSGRVDSAVARRHSMDLSRGTDAVASREGDAAGFSKGVKGGKGGGRRKGGRAQRSDTRVGTIREIFELGK